MWVMTYRLPEAAEHEQKMKLAMDDSPVQPRAIW